MFVNFLNLLWNKYVMTHYSISIKLSFVIDRGKGARTLTVIKERKNTHNKDWIIVLYVFGMLQLNAHVVIIRVMSQIKHEKQWQLRYSVQLKFSCDGQTISFKFLCVCGCVSTHLRCKVKEFTPSILVCRMCTAYRNWKQKIYLVFLYFDNCRILLYTEKDKRYLCKKAGRNLKKKKPGRF